MTHRLIIRVQAEADMAEAAMWYGNQRPGLGREFLVAVETALGNAVANPRQYPCLRRKPEVRRVLLTRFPYRIFFILRPDAVVVFRVLHGARPHREWKRNIPGN